MSYEDMSHIWKAMKRIGTIAPECLQCKRCRGSAIEPEYGDDDPCMGCHGFGFDVHRSDLRAMRLLGLA